ncbi:MAG: alanine racemase [Planctomycetota bacterium]
MNQPVARPYRVWAEIDLGALQRNADCLAQRLNPDTGLLAVLKADAYGHGAIPVARALTSPVARVKMIGVGDSQEALELRDAGIVDTPVLVLGTIVPGEVDRVVAADISVCVHDTIRAVQLDDAAAQQSRVARVHLLVDTGMHRLGVRHDQAVELLRVLADCAHLRVEGICTHFSSAGEADRGFSHRQLQRFLTVLAQARELGIEPGHLHAASSAGLLNYPAAHLTMVRPGLSLHGIDPRGARNSHGEADDAGLEPTLSLRTQIAFIKELPEGAPVSYDRTWYTPTTTRIATLPVGYNDGFRRAFSRPSAIGGAGGAAVLVGGQRCPVVGRVTMDYTMIDVGGVPDAAVGDVVTLIGHDGEARIGVEELAAWAGTIPYDITCGLGRRVVRLYRTDAGDDFARADFARADFSR